MSETPTLTTAAGTGPAWPDNLVVADGELYYFAGFLEPRAAAEAFEGLMAELDWHEESLTIAGRTVSVPRLVAWHGEAGAVYRYSGVNHDPQAWTTTLSWLRGRVEQVCGHVFNSVLGNLYRNGQDSMGWHADQEKSLGPNPVIASLSFGSARLFKLRHNKQGHSLDLWLADGSLLLMRGSLQHHWRHCLPKTRTSCGARINLTFRNINPSFEARHG